MLNTSYSYEIRVVRESRVESAKGNEVSITTPYAGIAFGTLIKAVEDIVPISPAPESTQDNLNSNLYMVFKVPVYCNYTDGRGICIFKANGEQVGSAIDTEPGHPSGRSDTLRISLSGYGLKSEATYYITREYLFAIINAIPCNITFITEGAWLFTTVLNGTTATVIRKVDSKLEAAFNCYPSPATTELIIESEEIVEKVIIRSVSGFSHRADVSKAAGTGRTLMLLPNGMKQCLYLLELDFGTHSKIVLFIKE